MIHFPQGARRSILSGSTLAALLLALTMLLSACGSTTDNSPSATGTQVPCPQTNQLTGAGSTFDNPLFTKMFSDYANARCQIEVNYQSVGSGAGITQLLNQTVDFGATDTPLTDAQEAQSTNGTILHIPVTIGAVAVSYNLSKLTTPQHLQLNGQTVADIFLGKVTKWNDPEIAATNSGVTLPDETITVVHRSDGSGTTGIFTHYLSAISTDWNSKVGAATTVNWPVGVGAKGNDGVANAVKTTEGAIGYNELAYVLTNSIQYASVQDHDGDYVLPSLDSAKAAAGSITTIPADLRFFFVNAAGKNAYPITGFSWVVVYQTQKDADKGEAVADTVWWMIHDGQKDSTALSYVPLPANIVQKGEGQIKAMQCGGSACYKG